MKAYYGARAREYDERSAGTGPVSRPGAAWVVEGARCRLRPARVTPARARWTVYTRYVTGDRLAGELGGEALHEGRWFGAVRA